MSEILLSPKPWWRGLIYLLAGLTVMISLLWLLEGTMAPMGYGGRSKIQITFFNLLIVFLPFVLAVALALRAVLEARRNQLGKSVAFVSSALILLPAVWLLDVFVVQL